MNQLIVLTSAKEELFMNYTNAELIKMGVPISAVLPGSAFWKKNKVFKSNTAIWNFDPVSTNSSGSSISLDATKADLNGRLGGIILLKGAVNMSAAKDSIIVKSSNQKLSSSGAALSLENPDWLKIPVTFNLGNGNNSVIAGLGYAGWETGIDLSGGTRLLSGTGNDIIKGSGKLIGISQGGTISTGTGNDIIKGSGKETGISVVGTISTGAGDDIIEGRGIKSYGIGGGSSINMGEGNDRLTGIGGPESAGHGSNYLSGWIDMGGGNDEITGTSFMFRGPDKIQMGAGNDKFIAPLRYSRSSSGAPIDFGSGIDRLYLPNGKYTVTDKGAGKFMLSSAALTDDGQAPSYGAESISGLEWLVSARTGAEYAFKAGTLDIA